MFHTYVATVYSKMFQLFQSYVAANGFRLQVASVIFGCFMCSTHMLQLHVPSVSFVFGRTLHSKKISCCTCFMLFSRGRAEGLEDGARGTPRGCCGWGTGGERTGAPIRGTQSPDSRVPPARREERVSRMTGERRYEDGVCA